MKHTTSAGASKLEAIVKHFDVVTSDESSLESTLTKICEKLTLLREATNKEDLQSRYTELKSSIDELNNQLVLLKPKINNDMDRGFHLLRDEADLPESMKPKSFLEHTKEFLLGDIQQAFGLIVKEATRAAIRTKRQNEKSEERQLPPSGPKL